MLNDTNNAYNSHRATSGDVQTPACTLYALLSTWPDAYNNVVNAYNSQQPLCVLEIKVSLKIMLILKCTQWTDADGNN